MSARRDDSGSTVDDAIGPSRSPTGAACQRERTETPSPLRRERNRVRSNGCKTWAAEQATSSWSRSSQARRSGYDPSIVKPDNRTHSRPQRRSWCGWAATARRCRAVFGSLYIYIGKKTALGRHGSGFFFSLRSFITQRCVGICRECARRTSRSPTTLRCHRRIASGHFTSRSGTRGIACG